MSLAASFTGHSLTQSGRTSWPHLKDLLIHLWLHSRCSCPSHIQPGRAEGARRERETLWRKIGFVNGGICGGREGFSVCEKQKSQHEHLHTQFDRGREPSGDLYFCIERFTVLHSSFFLFWIQTKASSYIKLIWVNRQKNKITKKTKQKQVLTQKINSSKLQSWCVPSSLMDALLTWRRAWTFSIQVLFPQKKVQCDLKAPNTPRGQSEGVLNKIICNKLTVYSFPMYIHVFKINLRSLSITQSFFLSLWTLQIIYWL